MSIRKIVSPGPASFALLAVLSTVPFTARAADEQGQPDEATARMAIGTATVTSANMKLVNTAITTENNGVGLSPTPVAAFVPITVTCPARAPRGCTVSVLVSSQFWAVDGGVVQVNTLIAGSAGLVNPNSLVNVDSTSTGGFANSRTFQWMKTAIPAASAETVTVEFRTSGGTANAGFRTLQVQLLKN